jgi:outer membrane protein
MQKIQGIVLSVLTLAVIALFVLHFTSKPTKKEESRIKTKSDSTQIASDVAYINVDSLLKKYKYSVALENRITERQKSLENDLNTKMAAFEKEAQIFQHKVQNNGFLSQESAQRQEQELTAKQQNLYKLRDDLSQQLAEETQVLNKQLLDTVTNFLKQFNADKKYAYILNRAAILYGSDAMNITDTVVFMLNKRYDGKK